MRLSPPIIAFAGRSPGRRNMTMSTSFSATRWPGNGICRALRRRRLDQPRYRGKHRLDRNCFDRIATEFLGPDDNSSRRVRSPALRVGWTEQTHERRTEYPEQVT